MNRCVWILWVIAALSAGCSGEDVEIKGKIQHLEGKVVLSVFSPESNDTLVVAEQMVELGDVNFTVSNLKIPARLWMSWGKKGQIEFIVDHRKGTFLKGDALYPDSIKIEGSDLEKEYTFVYGILQEKYDVPMNKLDSAIRSMKNRGELSGGEKEALAFYQKRREHYGRCRELFVRRMVESNPEQNLSLFLIWDELQDSTDVQRSLFEKMQVRNKKSNVYRLLSAKLK